jgi:uncharacterized protein YebE (UPF0316 family)
MFDNSILVTGVLIFVARIFDVSIGTIRTIVTVQGRTVIAFWLAIVEVIIWVTVASPFKVVLLYDATYCFVCA